MYPVSEPVSENDRMEQAILQRLPDADFVIPKKVRHVKDDRGENFVVYFPRPVMCKDGMTRASVWFRCSEFGHERAKTAVLGYFGTGLCVFGAAFLVTAARAAK